MKTKKEATVETQTQRTDLWTRDQGWGGRRGEVNGESSVDARYTTMCKIGSQTEASYVTQGTHTGLRDNREGGGGKGGGRDYRREGAVYTWD